jgi:hypothetical protein
MPRRSSRILEILRETIEQAEQASELGPGDPGVIELKRLLSRWLDEWQREMQASGATEGTGSKEPSSNGEGCS